MKMRTFAAVFVALGFYVFSVGPVCWFLGPDVLTSLGKDHSWVHAVYYPLGQLPAPVVSALEDYVQWWVDRRQ